MTKFCCIFRVTHDVGSVAALRRVKDAIAVAHAVMKYTTHTLLVGDQGQYWHCGVCFSLFPKCSVWLIQGGSRIERRRVRQPSGGGNIRNCQIFRTTAWNWEHFGPKRYVLDAPPPPNPPMCFVVVFFVYVYCYRPQSVSQNALDFCYGLLVWRFVMAFGVAFCYDHLLWPSIMTFLSGLRYTSYWNTFLFCKRKFASLENY